MIPISIKPIIPKIIPQINAVSLTVVIVNSIYTGLYAIDN